MAGGPTEIIHAVRRHLCLPVLLAGLSITLIGCAQQPLVSGAELAKFNAAGPIKPQVDTAQLTLAARPTAVYKVAAGDVLEIYMPRVMATVANKFALAEQDKGRHITRVYQDGQIIVPLIGRLDVTGKTPQDIENDLINGFNPKFLKVPPTVIVNVQKYREFPVTVMGAVKQPGAYGMRRNEMSLISVLNKAGGINDEGARAIRITRGAGNEAQDPILLPIKGLNIEFDDVAIQEGDLVEVERFDLQSISVIGLVKSPSTFPYPPGDSLNLFSAIARAGGMNDVAEPKYATIYRLSPDGSIAAARFKVIGKNEVPAGATVKLKPGDVVAVEQTPETRLRLLIDKIVQVSFGVSYDPINNR